MFLRWLFWPLFAAVMGFAAGGSLVWTITTPAPRLVDASQNGAQPGAIHSDETVWHWMTQDAIGVFALWLIIIPGGQLLLFAGQVVMIRQSLAEAKSAAETAKKAANAARLQAEAIEQSLQRTQDSSVRQLRAYVFPDAAILKKAETWQYTVSFKNFGQTPAYAFSQFTASAVVAEPATTMDPAVKRTGPISHATLPPRHAVRTTKSHPVTAAEAADIRSGRKCFHVFGDVQYIDAFGRLRTAKFRYVHNKDCGPTELIVSELGNEEI